MNSEEMAEKIIKRLDDLLYFEQIRPEFFGCEFLHDKTLYQKHLRNHLKIIIESMDFTDYHYRSSKESMKNER